MEGKGFLSSPNWMIIFSVLYLHQIYFFLVSFSNKHRPAARCLTLYGHRQSQLTPSQSKAGLCPVSPPPAHHLPIPQAPCRPHQVRMPTLTPCWVIFRATWTDKGSTPRRRVSVQHVTSLLLGRLVVDYLWFTSSCFVNILWWGNLNPFAQNSELLKELSA